MTTGRILNDRYELVAVDAVRPHPRNPRVGDLAAISESISKNGFYGAIVAQRSTGYILAGNHRWLAAKKSGLTEVPVLWIDVDDRAAVKILLADNRTSDLGEYDDEALVGLLRELRTEEDLAGTGFSEKDVDKLIAEGNEPSIERLADGDEDDDASLEEVPETPDSQRGEVYQLGPHRLMCGDATAVTDLDRLLDGVQADLLWTDPPYNVGYEGKTKKKLRIENDAMSADAFRTFLIESFSTASCGMRDGACFYIAHADLHGHDFRLAVLQVGWKLSQCLIWAKDQFVLGRADYHWRHEPILYGWKEGAAHHALADRTQDTVWQCARPRRNDEHPTMKPIALVERAIRNSTNAGDRVLDPFGGSGTTLIAAARSGRIAYLMELDPRYCDVIRKRWAKFEAAGDATSEPRAA